MNNNNQNGFNLNRQTLTIIIVGLAVAIVILLIMLYGILSLNPGSSPEPTQIIPTEPWPTPRPSVTPTASPTPKATVTPLPTATPIVIDIQELGYLTSVKYTLKTTVALDRPQEDNFFCDTLNICGSDRVILSAVGDVYASIDMSQINDEDVQIDGTSVKIVLPAATITGVELLPEETIIYDSEQKWFLSQYEGLEIEALDVARTQLHNWALNRVQILDTAESLAQAQLESFLRQLGFEEVEITFKEKEE